MLSPHSPPRSAGRRADPHNLAGPDLNAIALQGSKCAEMATLLYTGPGGIRCLLARKETADGIAVVFRVETPAGIGTEVPPNAIVQPAGLTAMRMVRAWAESYSVYPGFTKPDREGIRLANAYCAQWSDEPRVSCSGMASRGS